MHQANVAKEIGISEANLSLLLSGAREIGKPTAKRMARATGLPWNEIIAMGADELRAMLDEHFKCHSD
jgi:transcriptional regulator with XRE-family HTH domain